jgi:serine/threonine protein kinase
LILESDSEDFSDEEVDKDNRFHYSFIGVPSLPKGCIKRGKKLGEGMFGQVYQGTWRKENRLVALKKIDPVYAKRNFGHLKFSDEQILESLQWEVSRMLTVNHPNCVQFYGIYQNKPNTRTYVVMELCEGGTLSKVLEQKSKLAKTVAVGIRDQPRIGSFT